MKKQLPWKRLFAAVLTAGAVCLLLAELGGVFWFFAGVFGLSALWVFGRSWWDVRRTRRAAEENDSVREAVRQGEIDRRREACRKARYCREEQERLEARFRSVLGPIQAWDLEKGEEALCLDAALIPPTEALPFWKAATMGAGAFSVESGRTELVMALPPDWDPANRWPVQVLRDAARRFLIVDGFVGYNSVYRGLSILSAGFAGAAVTDDFPGLPDLGAAAMPGDLPVGLYWLVPLLKPELEYFQRRGLAGLERRFPAEHPWADSRRAPCANPLTWFQEDIAPFTWSEEGGGFCLGLNTGDFHQELFLSAGLTGTGWDWERLVRAYLWHYQPDDGPFVEYACEEGVFFAVSDDEEILRNLALGLSDLLREDWTRARRLLAPDPAR